MSAPLTIFWFRRDLRIHDNHGLYQALKSGAPVLPVFIFDDTILDRLPRRDARVEFIVDRIRALAAGFKEAGGALRVYKGSPIEIWPRILDQYKPKQIFCNEDYEPYAISRDQKISELTAGRAITFHSYKDQVIFEKDEVVKSDGQPYRVFTPYSRQWLKQLDDKSFKAFPSEKNLEALAKIKSESPPGLNDLGFEPSGIEFPNKNVRKEIFARYAKNRNEMGIAGTSRLGLHLRFGTASLRQVAKVAQQTSATFLSELIWREFFMQILFHYPRTVSEPFDSRYKGIEWREDKKEFQKWCDGRTGYPIVDAGMRELNATGFMHNRARMITASFLTKHLLIDWKWGERYFAEKLLDFELASNVGGWQWVAGCGCDAAPYFRVFNPTLQAKKFDAKGDYVKKWVPEFGTSAYPEPMVDHEFARRRVLQVFAKALKGAQK